MSSWEGSGDRFSLLLLEDGEYYFRDYNCHLWKEADKRVVGHLKVCSASLYFVPRDVHEPISRIPYRCTTLIERVLGEKTPSGEDLFRITATERIDMKLNNQNAPYKRNKGDFEFRMSLAYTGLEEVLPTVEELSRVAQAIQNADNKEAKAAARLRLAVIIQEHEENERFNPGWLEDENEKIVFELVGAAVTPLCRQPGRLVLTYARIYFQPFNVVSSAPIQTYQLNKVVSIIKRVYQLEAVGLELFFSNRNSLYLTFRSHAEREAAHQALLLQPDVKLQDMKPRAKWTKDWVTGAISNFEYLMYLNREAGRSFKDLTQYPVFPWIIADYTSRTLDLNNPATFRDLSKPIGALNPKRLNEFRERFQEMVRMCAAGGGKAGAAIAPLEFPPFLYGCHYSTPGYVVFYLMRAQPQLMLRLQNGRFDAPDRLFWSIMDTWRSVMTLPTDVKELTPEFYSSDPSFLLNLTNCDFGVRTNGERVGNVELPPWASDAQDFVQKLAEALEAPAVSRRLHKWIDLIFGHKNQGLEAEKADNVFHYLTYDSIALEQLSTEPDPVMREALRVQMMEFGRTPQQLFRGKHPKRRVHFNGSSGLCGCFKSQVPAHPARPANLLSPMGPTPKNANAVSRALARLTSRKTTIRADTLAWLEATARTREPDALALKSVSELVPLVKACRDCNDLYQEVDDLLEVLVRCLRALAVCPANRSLILDAGALEVLIELVCCGEPVLSEPALHVVSMLARENDPRMAAFNVAAMRTVLDLLLNGDPTELELKAIAASTIGALARTPANRAAIASMNGVAVLVEMVGRRDASRPLELGACEAPRVRRESALALCAMLEDDALKAELADTDGVAALVAMGSETLTDLRTAGLQCLAVLASDDRLKQSIVEQGGVGVLCAAASSSNPELQRAAAAALANLAGDASLAGGLAQGQASLEALVALANSSDRDVQKHAARAFWHLAAAEGGGARVLEAGGLEALLRLAQPAARHLQSRTLARQALKRLGEEPEVRAQILAAAGLSEREAADTVFSTSQHAGPGLTSHPSFASTSTGTPAGDGSAPSTPHASPLGDSLQRQPSAADRLDREPASSSGTGSPLAALRAGGPFRRHRRSASASSASAAGAPAQASLAMAPSSSLLGPTSIGPPPSPAPPPAYASATPPSTPPEAAAADDQSSAAVSAPTADGLLAQGSTASSLVSAGSGGSLRGAAAGGTMTPGRRLTGGRSRSRLATGGSLTSAAPPQGSTGAEGDARLAQGTVSANNIRLSVDE